MKVWLTVFHPNSEESVYLGVFDGLASAKRVANVYAVRRGYIGLLTFKGFFDDRKRKCYTAGSSTGGYVVIPFTLGDYEVQP